MKCARVRLSGLGVVHSSSALKGMFMFAFVEVPIVAFAFAPEWTTATTIRFNAWLGRNARRLAAYVLAAVGLYLTVRGLVQLFG